MLYGLPFNSQDPRVTYIADRMKMDKREAADLMARLQQIAKHVDKFEIAKSWSEYTFDYIARQIVFYMPAAPVNYDIWLKKYPQAAEELNSVLNQSKLDEIVTTYDKVFDFVAEQIDSIEQLVHFHQQYTKYSFFDYFNSDKKRRNERNAQIYAEKISHKLYHFSAVILPLIRIPYNALRSITAVVSKYDDKDSVRRPIFELEFDPNKYADESSDLDINRLQNEELDEIPIENLSIYTAQRRSK